jgi:hypothetical protein
MADPRFIKQLIVGHLVSSRRRSHIPCKGVKVMSLPRLGTFTTDLIWWVCESPTRLRIALYGSMLIGPSVIATLTGSGILVALKLAGLQAGVLAVSLPIALAIRRLGRM